MNGMLKDAMGPCVFDVCFQRNLESGKVVWRADKQKESSCFLTPEFQDMRPYM